MNIATVLVEPVVFKSQNFRPPEPCEKHQANCRKRNGMLEILLSSLHRFAQRLDLGNTQATIPPIAGKLTNPDRGVGGDHVKARGMSKKALKC